MLNRENLSKSVIAKAPVKKGSVIKAEDLTVASPGQGLAPYKLSELIGLKAIRDISEGDFLVEADLTGNFSNYEPQSFPIMWGVPVRYHDFRDYKDRISPDLYEFHYSYRDLGLDPKNYIDAVDCRRLGVHAPELFENSELLDLVSDDLNYRHRSIDNIKRVIEATEALRPFFANADSALIVANIGGFSMDGPVSADKRRAYYDRFREEISRIDFGSTELIPQNMAPLPWHFGGQRYQNIFMYPDEIVEHAKASNLRICLDVSHLSMTCTYFGLDLIEALQKLMPVSAHLHIADAKGMNGEGVGLGEGDVDWSLAWPLITGNPDVSFIPEIWQGHKNFGKGFWDALAYLGKL